ncbi:2-keto-4-pentenoate hydratase/2-oxohepta-3-ene-1,7-dioic acid hydratase (catechol pathway) [Streptoalloteichus tenebrarius]|uniref:2-keto-4-pentenoate hydratase/2-oxohepta-3-ene-1,7-dioic acid hydratase (Catechol pathway) n=1 Tax=Streptoalloteichus tenebrarius (strain ATCC 17920 / DSM 40477 / JCM 4838 / CBS 697.72 / NBRC 16177 / NCIMB 11028 / NRRL B-12390 / A12253. 1 / ISP 5477) TaxID=1933 RepID=A0ABT1HRJ0_STRSD|nr:fumarylacetoacetate hydrolase family protein [Streptoalloteichus tenebrarius]MCP2258132.1 2-keto-4-pentenoate hydratase/2-oxohepta-3-ene-1,7-dioic acid hydratase (catechol pathway) [Streptoalloteichus tenebrarius]BFF04642.1 fumarylacetoacetate hydrolase family protein [Streptoalloteichus tenebrarius]
MRWVTYDAGRGVRTGLLVDDRIHAVAEGVSLVDLVAHGREGLEQAGREATERPAEVVALEEVRLLPPIPRPPSVRDALCFLDHMRNCQQVMGGGRTLSEAWYEIPAFYFAAPSSLVGPYDDVPLAPGSAWFDVELEIAAVIGAGGRDLTPERAEEQIVGYTIYGDWSARDLQVHEGALRIGQGKGKDAATTLGPWLVTPDELEPFERDGRLDLAVEFAVNGRTIGVGSTGAMDWTFAEVVSYVSRGVELRPGDVIGSGTVPTCTLIEHFSLMNPGDFPGWLRPGDVVTLAVEGLGRTRQTVVAAPDPAPLPPRPNPDRRARAPRVNPATSRFPYERGLHRVGQDVWAWLEPDGGYGWSNAGLVRGDGASLLVDTLFDLPMTERMLTAMAEVTVGAPIRDAVLTHANGDHTHGNQLLDPDVRIIAAAGTARDMHHEMPPDSMVISQVMDLGPVLTPYMRERFAPFRFAGIQLRLPDETFEDRLTVDVGGREVHVINLGPAHTSADSVVHVPDAGVLFAGDLLFIGGTPVVWAGPIANWIAACDAMIALDAPTVVPGHGPVTDPDGIRAVRDYLAHVVEQADAAYAQGLSAAEAAARIDLGEYATWLDAERVVVNVHQRYRELDPTLPQPNQMELMAAMAQWDADRGR